MKNIHATRKGPGRRPQTTSSERHAHEVSDSCEVKVFVRDFAGAKIARKAINKTATINH